MAKKFTQREVEQLIAGIREAYEIKIRQLNYRLEGLTGENRSLRASLAEYKDREGKVGKAIVAAEEKGEEIKEFYRMSALTEWQTLRLFADKWKALAAQTERILPQDESEKYARYAENLSALLGKEAPFAAAEEFAAQPPEAPAPAAEAEERPAEPFDPKAVIQKYVEGEEDSGFNLSDVINPKGKLDLEKLCRNLGLMDEDNA